MKQPIEWFYGRGLPLSPYSSGFILHQIREEFKPQQLVLPPDDLMVEGERVNMEYTLYRNWMEGQYLKDLHWYHKYLFLEYDPSLETLFDPLVVCSSYKRKPGATLNSQVQSFLLVLEDVRLDGRKRSRVESWNY
jgi:hypothetical protein